MIASNLPLGTKVTFDQKYHRIKKYECDENAFNKRVRLWEPRKACYGKPGIIIGVRNLQNGIVYTEDGVKQFEPKEYIKAYLVVVDLSLNPIYVPYDNVKLIEDEKTFPHPNRLPHRHFDHFGDWV